MEWWSTAIPFDPSDGVVWGLVFLFVQRFARRATTPRQRHAIPFLAGVVAVLARAAADVGLQVYDAGTFDGVTVGTFLRAVAVWGTVILRHVLAREIQKATDPDQGNAAPARATGAREPDPPPDGVLTSHRGTVRFRGGYQGAPIPPGFVPPKGGTAAVRPRGADAAAPPPAEPEPLPPRRQR